MEGKEKKVVMKLFGVEISGDAEEFEVEEEEEIMRKSSSVPNLATYDAADRGDGGSVNGYASDGALRTPSRKTRRRKAPERKKGVPWTEEEHRTFLAGLQMLGKGDWRGISKNFVTTRTPSQVASHAQKYFLRQSNPGKKKRRSSLFDVVITEQAPVPATTPTLLPKDTCKVAKQETNHTDCSNNLVAPQGLQSSPTLASVTSYINKVDAPNNLEKRVIMTLSLALPAIETEGAIPPDVGRNDLELSIALPRTHDPDKFSSHGAMEGIRVL